MELWVRREHPLYNMRHLVSQPQPAAVHYVMFNPLSNAKVEIVRARVCLHSWWGGCKYGEHDSGAPLAEHLFLFLSI